MDNKCETPFERDSCIQCALKHLSQARVLLLEKDKGYPVHAWFAMGHMAEAEDELLKDHLSMSELVRDERLKLQSNDQYEIDFAYLIKELIAYDYALADDLLEERDG